ncbi:hypothetical protein IFM89_005762 [Coptis chinensis]|uniref:Uncharacterized protein n=1 Tax=Coptis chinensis TaxID=261450 RepID=A0A835M4D9_9MAGN|nr:hypothetical protein IFM89_005762 [Coptis chinensis]
MQFSMRRGIIIYSKMELYCRVLRRRYRVAEVEWIQDIYPLEGTRDRQDLQEMARGTSELALSWIRRAREAAQTGLFSSDKSLLYDLDCPLNVYLRNRPLREEVYRAYVTRASSGDFDNTPIINQILKLRFCNSFICQHKWTVSRDFSLPILCNPVFAK